MSDPPDPVEAGAEITFMIMVGSGPGTATQVQLQSAVPAQTTPVEAKANDPGTTCEASRRRRPSSSATSARGPLPPTGSGPDQDPPGQVSRVRATAGDRSVAMRWRLPSDSDFAHVVITRSAVNTRDRVVYTGRGQDFVDRGLRNGTLYMYELRTVDRSGNTSDGVWTSARPRGTLLFNPRPNARLSSPPMLRWVAVPGTLHYNVQLYRGSRKVLSVWPRGNHFERHSQWRYAGRRERLLPGVYHWFVWPGRGRRARSSYGPLLGRSSFVIVPPV